MKSKVRAAALKNGWRSGLEEKMAELFKRLGVLFRYEDKQDVVEYEKPARKARYTPDFVLPNGIVVETKGRFVTADRQKHILIRDQHPDLDIRLVFSNPNTRISKQSKTTYAMWCEKNGIPYCAFKDTKTLETWAGEKPKSKNKETPDAPEDD